jgi:hypothetical protein
LVAPAPGARREHASEIVNQRLTLRALHGHQIFAVFCEGCGQTLTTCTRQTIVPAMNGLNHICGICPEIIR